MSSDYHLGKDIAEIQRTLGRVETRLDALKRQSRGVEHRAQGEIYISPDTMKLTEENPVCVTLTAPQHTIYYLLFGIATIELCNTGQWNFFSVIENQDAHRAYDTIVYSFWIYDLSNTQIKYGFTAFKGYVGAAQTVKLAVPNWGGAVADHFDQLKNGQFGVYTNYELYWHGS